MWGFGGSTGASAGSGKRNAIWQSGETAMAPGPANSSTAVQTGDRETVLYSALSAISSGQSDITLPGGGSFVPVVSSRSPIAVLTLRTAASTRSSGTSPGNTT